MDFTVVGNVAAVTQLVGNAAGLIRMIIQAVETARQNKRECEHLALRLSIIGDVLPGLPQDPELERPLKELGKTLREAHELVLACQTWSAANQFFGARRHADSFRGVNSRIDSHLSLFPLVIYSALANRLYRISPPDQAGEPTVPSPGSSSGSRQTQTVVPDDTRVFKWAELSAATNNFAIELARGSSETVYKGRLYDGPAVAVKVLEKHNRQGKEDAFVAERFILSPLRHNHIVRLVGWCAVNEDRMFVYEHEHMSNGTLRDHLLRARSGSSSSTASWRARVDVLLGASRAIRHLHHRSIIHRDVSSSNILLDASWAPRLSGFGLALLRSDDHPVEVVGTFGYIDPEYELTKRVSQASDVYSFGVVMLEALTGRPPVSVLTVTRNEKLRDVLDDHPALQPTTPRQLEALELVAHTARCCLWPHGKDRPPMSEVVDSLKKALGIIRSDEPDLLCY